MPAVDVRAAWIAWLAAAPSTTARARVGDLQCLGRWLQQTTGERERTAQEIAAWLVTISRGELLALVAAWRGWAVVQEHAGATIARRISTIASWLRTCNQHGLEWQIRLPRPRVMAYQIRGCEAWGPLMERVAALREAERWRELVAVELLLFVGLRRAEACALQATDLERGDPPQLRLQRKGGTIEWRTITPQLVATIDRVLDGRTRGPLLVSHCGRRLTPDGLRAMVRRLGLPNPHRSRHAAASELWARTRDAALVQGFLGHATLAATSIYVHALDDHAGRATRLLSE